MRILTRRRGEEDGATAVIVVLCLIALFGMLVLVVDVGGLLLRRRAMVNGADAAALAAAKSCILSVAQDPRSPEQASDEWAAVNVNGVNTAPANIVQIAGCDSAPSGYVSVRYDAPQQLFFAPVLGYSDQGTVTTAATAVWGPAGAANVIPIIVYANSFNNCKLDQDPIDGTRCYVWEDNGNTAGSQSKFGLLDLDISRGWDVDRTQHCTSVPANDLRNWIQDYPDPDIGDLPINYPAPTYVCARSGMAETAWSALEGLEGQIVFFPMNRCYDTLTGNETNGQVTDPGNAVACGDTPGKYDVIGYVAFRLIDVLRPNDAGGAGGSCSVTRAFPASSGMSLDTFGNPTCFTTPPDAIDGASVSVRRNGGPASQRGTRGPDGATCVGTTFDYCYDPATRTVLWNSAGPAPENQNYTVSFDWSNDGPCGTVPGNNSAHCLVVDYVDTQIGGSRPGQGDPNSNIRAYKLCEPSVPSTCAPISVPVP
jgi:Flp pilus assembly protein TadG